MSTRPRASGALHAVPAILIALAGSAGAIGASAFPPSINLSSLNGTTGFVLNGIDGDDFSGISVSSAGDVNDDGINDLIIGAQGADPNGHDAAGESYVVFGKDTAAAGLFAASINLSSLNGTTGFVLNGIEGLDFSGTSVSSAGDVNGDGIDDLVIGAGSANPNGIYAAGQSYIVFGKNTAALGPFAASINLSSLNGTTGFALNGIDALDSCGISVSSAGDVNGDGVDDLIIGAEGADPNGNDTAGESYVVFGKNTALAGPFATSIDLSSLDGTTGFVLNGIDGDDFSGTSVSSAGDVNGDGVDDLIIGAKFADPNGQGDAGESYVVFGKDTAAAGPFAASIDLSSLDGTTGFILNGIDANDRSGFSVSSAGDVNGDGVDDLIIGAHLADPNGSFAAGESYVVFGKDTAALGPFAASINLSSLNGTTGFVLNGIDANDLSGFSVSSAGDVNGDGVDDLIIGAEGADPNGSFAAGESYVVFGKDTALAGPFAASINLSSLNGTTGFVLNGIDANDLSGFSVSSAGDVNGDGVDDLIIGAEGADPNGNDTAGESYVVFGRMSQCWSSASGGSWDTASKWLSGAVPIRGLVAIDTATGVTVTGPADAVFLDRLTLRAHTGRTMLNLVANSFISVVEPVIIPASAGVGGYGVLSCDAGITNSGLITPTDLTIVPNGGLTNSGDIRIETFTPSPTPKALAVFGSLSNSSVGEVVVRGAAVMDVSGGTTNSGTISIGFANASIYGPVANSLGGLISISGGSEVILADNASNSSTIELTTNSSLSIFGTLAGNGIDGPGGGASGPVYVEGGIIPAFALQAGIAHFGGNVSLGSVGVTVVEIGGTSPGTTYDQIDANGTLGVAGTLRVNLINGYAPHPGDAYKVLDFAARTGSFSSVILDPVLITAGANISTLLIDGTIRIPAAPACDGDVNGDGKTNVADFNILAGHFGQIVPPHTLGDLSGNGVVNVGDFNILAGDFGCVTP